MHHHLSQQHQVLRNRRAGEALFTEVIDQPLRIGRSERMSWQVAQQRNDVRTQSVAHYLPCGASDFSSLNARRFSLHQSRRKVTDKN
jgi:hypothetical protein